MSRPRRALFAVLPILGALAFACRDGQKQQVQQSPPTMASSATLEVRLHGLFGLHMPAKEPDGQGNLTYDPLYVISPRTNEPAANAEIPDGLKDIFVTDWLPSHHTIVQIPLRNMIRSSGSEPGGVLTLSLDLRVGESPAPAVLSDLEFPCADGEKGPVTIGVKDAERIPPVLVGGDSTTHATMDRQVREAPASVPHRVAMRLVLRCREKLTVAPRMFEGKAIAVSPAFLHKPGTIWVEKFVNPSSSTEGGRELVFTRPVGSGVQVRWNGLPYLSLHPDSAGKISISIRTLPGDEYFRGESHGPNTRTGFEHFRLLYALATKADKEKAPYYYYGWLRTIAGSPFCDTAGKFTK